MILTRWNADADVDRLLKTVFDDSFGAWGRHDVSPTWSPRMNVHENDENFHVEAVMPGLNMNDIEITTHKQVLTIRGERKAKETTTPISIRCISRISSLEPSLAPCGFLSTSM